MSVLKKRMLAFALDYLILALYALLLFAITMFLYTLLKIDVPRMGPFVGQLIGFITLTLPVFLYFYLSEKSKHKATFGKRKLGLWVIEDLPHRRKNLLLRNILKFLPWEIAHTGVHWLRHDLFLGNSSPFWVWALLIIPQIIVMAYFISIILYKGESSVYDKFANARIGLHKIN